MQSSPPQPDPGLPGPGQPALASRLWAAPRAGRGCDATVRVPGSKSLTNRALIVAAQSAQPTRLVGALACRDTHLMAGALRALGTQIDWSGPSLTVTPAPLRGGTVTDPVIIDCGLAGTVMRFVPLLAVTAPGVIEFRADAQAAARPIKPTLDTLRALGVGVECLATPEHFPFRTVSSGGPVPTSELVIDGLGSSQFFSAALLAAPAWGRPVAISVAGRVPSLPHIEMTIANLRSRGVALTTATRSGRFTVTVTPSTPRGGVVEIEPDLTNAGVFAAAALLTGGRATIPSWPAQTTQAGAAWTELLPRFGARVIPVPNGLEWSGNLPATASDQSIDMSDFGELVPTLAAVAAHVPATTTLTGIGHLRGHETDRLSALVTELGRFQIRAEADAETLTIHGRYPAPAPTPTPAPGTVTAQTYHDHRMAMFAALMGLHHPVVVENMGTVAKTFPDFPALWLDLIKPGPAVG